MIEAEGLKKAFGAVQAVADVSLSAADGEITGLLGPNGAGKSTTLRMLYTVLRPDAGSARVDGLDIASSPLDARRRIGVLPHSAGLYPHLTGRENIAYYARLNGLRRQDARRRVDAMVERLGLGEFCDRAAKGYSHGQRTRVALGRALVHDPPNVLLDEPTLGLDVMATRALRELVVELKGEGRCVLFSSHVMQEVAALCDRVVIIANGRVVANGSPDAIRRQTGETNLEDAFVAAVGDAEGLE